MRLHQIAQNDIAEIGLGNKTQHADFASLVNDEVLQECIAGILHHQRMGRYSSTLIRAGDLALLGIDPRDLINTNTVKRAMDNCVTDDISALIDLLFAVKVIYGDGFKVGNTRSSAEIMAGTIDIFRRAINVNHSLMEEALETVAKFKVIFPGGAALDERAVEADWGTITDSIVMHMKWTNDSLPNLVAYIRLAWPLKFNELDPQILTTLDPVTFTARDKFQSLMPHEQIETLAHLRIVHAEKIRLLESTIEIEDAGSAWTTETHDLPTDTLYT